MANCALTTFDNPYDPFEDYTSWMMFDKEKGYDSAERLMRIAKVTDDMTQKEEDIEIERAIDEIIFYDPFNVYTKLKKNQQTSSE